MNWQDKRVLILGAARQGQAAARWLVKHGAAVTVNDRRGPDQLAAANRALADIPISWVLGGHPLELLTGMDFLCLSGGIPLSNPLVVEALRRKIPLTNDTQLFMETAPCKTIGITGSAGKTTTTTLIGRMAKAAVELNKKAAESIHSVYVGGNIGDPLLNHVDLMKADDLAVLEISSFQLEQMTISPDIAMVLNITPNHLDRHGSMEAYTTAKARILKFQSDHDVAILGRDDPGSWNLKRCVQGDLLTFGIRMMPKGCYGTYIRDGRLILRTNDGEAVLLPEEIIRLRGNHNKLNVLAACAAAGALGLKPEAIQIGVEGFTGVAHRLEFIRCYKGAQWYNDSIATTPERSIAAIHSFDEPIVLLLGGRDKDLPWDDLIALIHKRVDHLILFGEVREKLLPAFGKQEQDERPYSVSECKNLKAAVWAAAEVCEKGDIVLLSPGGTSFDEFEDFEARGEGFNKWVHELS